MKVVNADSVKVRKRCPRKGKLVSSTVSASPMHALVGKIPRRFLRLWRRQCENGVKVLGRLQMEQMAMHKRMNLETI